MKAVKIISLVLAVVMLAMAFVSCGETEKKEDNETTTAPVVTEEDTTPIEEDNDGDDNVLTMATHATFPPYEYIENGEYAGIDIEISKAIAEKLGMTLEIVDTEFGSIIGGVQTGKYDMGMAGMTVTEERKQSVNFTNSYATGIQAVIVKEDCEYTDFMEFYSEIGEDGKPVAVKDGIIIGVQQDTTGDIYASSAPEKWGFGDENIVRYKTGADATQALVAGKVTAVITDNEPAKAYVAANEGLKILDGAYTEEQYAICIAKENTDLLDSINAALEELIDDGVIAEIIEKYIPSK